MSESVSKRRFSQFSLIFFAMTSLPGKLVVDVLQIRTTERSFYFLEEYGIVDCADLGKLFFFLFILLFVQKKPSNIKHPQHSSSNKSKSSETRKKRKKDVFCSSYANGYEETNREEVSKEGIKDQSSRKN